MSSDENDSLQEYVARERMNLAVVFRGTVQLWRDWDWARYADDAFSPDARPRALVAAVRFMADELVELDGSLGVAIGALPYGVLLVLNEVMAAVHGNLLALNQYFVDLVHDNQSYLALLNKAGPGIRKASEHLGFVRALRSPKRDGELERDLLEARHMLEALQQQSADVANLRDSALEALAAARSAAAQRLISNQADAFAASRISHRAAGIFWGRITIVLILALVVALTLSMNSEAHPPRDNESWTVAANLNYLAGHVLLVSLASFAIVVCLRNYRAAKHNEIMNAHRANALATFSEFRKVVEGKAADIITVEAASAIFAVQPSGFAEAGPPAATHLHEMVKEFGKGSVG